MLVKNVFIKYHPNFAGKWIYEGYRKAWESLGYKSYFYNELHEINNFDEKYYLMSTDGTVKTRQDLIAVKSAEKAFIFAQPETFLDPWGRHPNFICGCSPHVIKEINEMENCILWSWSDNHDYHTQWKKIHTIELAFDSISYKNLDKQNIYDVCYIGGWADNGFNEKRKIMLEYFKEFQKSGLDCGFFINKDISNEKENFIISNSKVCINIHDAHHHTTGFDTNERTFKTLGINGCVVSDSIGRGKETNQLKRLFPTLPLADSPTEMVEQVQLQLNKTSDELRKIKEENKKHILQNHTYVHRVKEMLTL